jgi:hypothetical protein
MSQFSIRWIGLDTLQVGFNRFVKSIPPITRERNKAAMERARKRSVSDGPFGAYTPAERGYDRTGNLKASTYIETDGPSVRIVVNAVRDGRDYGGYVVGNGDGYGQAGIHQGYWVTMRDAVDDEIEDLVRDIDEHLDESAEALGL